MQIQIPKCQDTNLEDWFSSLGTLYLSKESHVWHYKTFFVMCQTFSIEMWGGMSKSRSRPIQNQQQQITLFSSIMIELRSCCMIIL